MQHRNEEIRIDFGNGEIVLLDNKAIWEEIQDYINRRFDWLTNMPTRRSFRDDISQKSSAPLPEILDAPETTIDLNISTVLQERKINYLLWILGKFSGRLQYKEAYDNMVDIGYVDNSTNPMLNVISKARKYPDLVKLDNGNFVLTEKGCKVVADISLKYEVEKHDDATPKIDHNSLSKSDQSEAAEKNTSEVNQEIHAIDYLLRALVQNDGSAKYEDLIATMLADGWQTVSDTNAKLRRTISAIASKQKKYVDATTVRGQITILENGSKRIAAMERKQNSPALNLYGSETELSL